MGVAVGSGIIQINPKIRIHMKVCDKSNNENIKEMSMMCNTVVTPLM